MKPMHTRTVRYIVTGLALALPACLLDMPADLEAADAVDVQGVSYAASATPPSDHQCHLPTTICKWCTVANRSVGGYSVWLPAATVGPVYLEAGARRRKVWPSALPAREVDGIIEVDVPPLTPPLFGKPSTPQGAAAPAGEVLLKGIIEEDDCPSTLWSAYRDQH